MSFVILIGSRGLSGVSRVTLGKTGNEVVLKAPARRSGEVVKAARGTAVEDAQLHIEVQTGVINPDAQEILLESLHVEG